MCAALTFRCTSALPLSRRTRSTASRPRSSLRHTCLQCAARPLVKGPAGCGYSSNQQKRLPCLAAVARPIAGAMRPPYTAWPPAWPAPGSSGSPAPGWRLRARRKYSLALSWLLRGMHELTPHTKDVRSLQGLHTVAARLSLPHVPHRAAHAAAAGQAPTRDHGAAPRERALHGGIVKPLSGSLVLRGASSGPGWGGLRTVCLLPGSPPGVAPLLQPSRTIWHPVLHPAAPCSSSSSRGASSGDLPLPG